MNEDGLSSETLVHLIRQLGHDMRAPLGSLLSTSDLLADGVYDPITEKQSKAVERTRRSGRRTLAMLEDFVTYVKAESEELVLAAKPFDPAAKLVDWCAEACAFAQEKGLAFNVTSAAAVPQRLVGDEMAVGRVVLALVWNAVAFTAQGAIDVVGDWDTESRWVISVRDSGCGIPDEDKAHIFEPFWRGTSRPQVPTAGAGLGLPVAQALAKQLHGRVFLQETSPSGSRFRLELPLQPAEPA
jgi:signal transduction histidine kinase